VRVSLCFTLKLFEIIIIMKLLWEQDVAKRSDEFKNDCIPMHSGVRVVM